MEKQHFQPKMLLVFHLCHVSGTQCVNPEGLACNLRLQDGRGGEAKATPAHTTPTEILRPTSFSQEASPILAKDASMIQSVISKGTWTC